MKYYHPTVLRRTILATMLSTIFATTSIPVAAKNPLENIEKINLGESAFASAISSDNKIIGLMPPSANSGSAAILSGSNWQTKTILGTLRNDNEGLSHVIALSADGKIAAGRAAGNNDNPYIQRAVIWSGDNWQTKTDLGTFTNHPYSLSAVYALSADGKIAGGLANNQYVSDRAIIWSGKNWQTKTDLGTLRSDNSGRSAVDALSADGKIAAGWANNNASRDDDAFDYRAVIWSGNNWKTKTDLGTLKSDNSGRSEVHALSADGKVAAGGAHDDTSKGNDILRTTFDYRAIVWSGDNWQTKTALGTLKSDNSGRSEVYALSADGSIAAGQADDDNNQFRATLWSGRNWQTKTDLGTSDPNNEGSSSLFDISRDGTIAVGESNGRATLWRIRYNNTPTSQPPTSQPPTSQPPTSQPPTSQPPTSQPPTSQPPTSQPPTSQPPTSQPKTPTNVTAIDINNTSQTIIRLGADSLAALYMQKNALRRLHENCNFERIGKMCFRTETDISQSKNKRDTILNMTLGYRIHRHLSAGFSLGRSLKRKLPESYRSSSNSNHGFAIHGQWDVGSWFIRPSAAWNSYKVQAVRPTLAGTEAGVGNSRMRGQSYRLIGGQNFGITGETNYTWYTGIEHNRISRSAYTEYNVEFPVVFGKLSQYDTSLIIGADANLPITQSWSLQFNGEIGQPVNSQAPQYTAQADYIGTFHHIGKKVKPRIMVSSGIQYRFLPNLSATLTPYLERNDDGHNRRGIRMGLHGTF